MTASVNPEKANEALRRLMEETFPEIGHDRDEAVDKAMAIMEQEKEKAYAVAPVGGSMQKGPMGRIRNILKQRKRPGRSR